MDELIGWVGDIEQWKDVEGFAERYEISTTGVVKAKSYLKTGRNLGGPFSFMTTPRVLTQRTNEDGYKVVGLRSPNGTDHTAFVHRLLAKAFIENPESLPLVNHKDSVRSNNDLDNLEWCTAQQNVRHGYDFGNATNLGESHPRAILNDNLVREIRNLSKQGLSAKEIAMSMGFRADTVSAVLRGKNWSHVI